MSNDDGRKGRNLSHNFYYKIYHTVNRLRSFLSSSHSGHSCHFVIWVIWVTRVIWSLRSFWSFRSLGSFGSFGSFRFYWSTFQHMLLVDEWTKDGRTNNILICRSALQTTIVRLNKGTVCCLIYPVSAWPHLHRCS